MRNNDIADTREKLVAYVNTGLISLGDTSASPKSASNYVEAHRNATRHPAARPIPEGTLARRATNVVQPFHRLVDRRSIAMFPDIDLGSRCRLELKVKAAPK